MTDVPKEAFTVRSVMGWFSIVPVGIMTVVTVIGPPYPPWLIREFVGLAGGYGFLCCATEYVISAMSVLRRGGDE